MQKTTRKVAPDGGYAWVACFGVSLVNVSTSFYFLLFEKSFSLFHCWKVRKKNIEIQQVWFRNSHLNLTHLCETNELGFSTQLQKNWINSTEASMRKFQKFQRGPKIHLNYVVHAIAKKGEWLLSNTWWKKHQVIKIELESIRSPFSNFSKFFFIFVYFQRIF